jgi:hypothetical protein
VVGRIVAFRDPALGKASWQGGHTEQCDGYTIGET